MVFVALSCARSYFEKGRRQGMEEAIREMARGISSHCQLEDGGLPAITALNAIPFSKVRRPASATKPTDAYHAQLWILGDAIGEACWLKGHGAGMRRKAPAEGKIRVDLSMNCCSSGGWRISAFSTWCRTIGASKSIASAVRRMRRKLRARSARSRPSFRPRKGRLPTFPFSTRIARS